jgi:hypothetical protein
MKNTFPIRSMNRDQARVESLIAAARDSAPVAGLTHNFYRYPARFSPAFVKAAIDALSEPGDWVMDPFAGGGTTLVEALSAGRNAIGFDISALSTFVCEAKTTILSDRQAEGLREWASQLCSCINMHAPGHRFTEYADAGYYRYLGGFIATLDKLRGSRKAAAASKATN